VAAAAACVVNGPHHPRSMAVRRNLDAARRAGCCAAVGVGGARNMGGVFGVDDCSSGGSNGGGGRGGAGSALVRLFTSPAAVRLQIPGVSGVGFSFAGTFAVAARGRKKMPRGRLGKEGKKMTATAGG
ncbi:unnamed protein product, partial [Phaeothamnion confervicola]